MYLPFNVLLNNELSIFIFWDVLDKLIDNVLLV
jgi:hypothetical protein